MGPAVRHWGWRETTGASTLGWVLGLGKPGQAQAHGLWNLSRLLRSVQTRSRDVTASGTPGLLVGECWVCPLPWPGPILLSRGPRDRGAPRSGTCWFTFSVPCWGPARKHHLKDPFLVADIFSHHYPHVYIFGFPSVPLTCPFIFLRLN